MVSLLDIAPAADEVEVRGQKVTVTGITAEGFVSLLRRFPELASLMGGRGADVTPETIMGFGPKLVAAAIAAGTGLPGDEAAEKVAAGLGLDDQVALLVAIVKATLPAGIDPFVERLSALGGVLGKDVSAVASKAPDMKSPAP